MNVLQLGASTVVAIGAIAGGALTVESRYTPAQTFNRHVAEATRPFVFDTVERAAQAEPGSDYHRSLCRTLEQAIAGLCATAPDDAICLDREIHLERAGCR